MADKLVADPLIVPTAEGYNLWAAHYDGEGNPLIALEEPVVEQMLGDVRGLTVLDVGCGTGRHALRLAAAGAKVTAVDFSSGMLAQAQRKPGAGHVQFVHHDFTTGLPFDAASFDRVTCGLVLDHVASLEPLMREFGRVCRPAGTIIISIMHPAMMLRGVQARFVDPHQGREIRPQSHPNQLSDYTMAAVRAGLKILQLSEHAVDEAMAARVERAQKYLGWPMLFMMKLAP